MIALFEILKKNTTATTNEQNCTHSYKEHTDSCGRQVGEGLSEVAGGV